VAVRTYIDEIAEYSTVIPIWWIWLD